jgi:formate dehydrogenase subunit gamma
MSVRLRPTGSTIHIRWIPRYTFLERALHWGHTVTFLPLAMTGLVLFVPQFAPLARGEAGQFLRLIHRICAVFFGLVPILYALLEPHRLLATVRELGWSKDDLLWFKNAIPYYIFGKHVAMPPQRRWNTGEKLNVWIMVAGTITFGITGVVMWFGRGIVPTWLFQAAVIVHDLTMIVTVNMFIVHFFLAVVHPLMWQSLVSMRFGVVSESYAREHHAAWFYGEKRAKELYAQRLAQEQAKAQGGAGEK